MHELHLLQEEEGQTEPIERLPSALVIDGLSLLLVLDDVDHDGCRQCLLQLSQRCKAVVACRVSPDQKREMVRLIKVTYMPSLLTSLRDVLIMSWWVLLAGRLARGPHAVDRRRCQ